MTEDNEEPRYVTLCITEDDLTDLIDHAIARLDSSSSPPGLDTLIDRVLEGVSLDIGEYSVALGDEEQEPERCGYRRCGGIGTVEIQSAEDYQHYGYMCSFHADEFALDMERQAQANVEAYPVPTSGCLLVLKLAIARVSAPDEQAREERDRELEDHIESCFSCNAFITRLREES